jgi:hypothetical protein
MYGECGIVTIGFSFRWIEPDIDVMNILFVGERLDGMIEVYHRQRFSGALSRHVNRGERTPTHRRSVLMDLVVDASVLIAVILNEPLKDQLIAVTRGATLISPTSLPWEVGDAL